MAEQLNNNEKSFFDTIWNSLKDLMEKITSGLNSILVKLWLKKEQELKKIDNLTKDNLDALYKKIEKDSKLSENEEEEINKVEEFKEYYWWLTKNFGKNSAKKEMASFIENELLERIEDKELTGNEQNEIKDKIKKQQKSLKKDETLTNITKEILNGSYNYTIDEIIEAYDNIKWENIDPTKENILVKLSGNEENNSEESSE